MTAPEELRAMLRGPIVAVTTPFKLDLSSDLDGLCRLIDFYCESGIGPLIVGGSTGEFFSLNMVKGKPLSKSPTRRTGPTSTISRAAPKAGGNYSGCRCQALIQVSFRQVDGAYNLILV